MPQMPSTPAPFTRDILDQIMDTLRGKRGTIELPGDEPEVEVPASTAPAAAPAAAPTPATSHSPSAFNVQVPGELIDAPGAGLITVQVPGDTPPDQMRDVAMRMAKEQASGNSLAVQSGGGDQFGFQMPDIEATDPMRDMWEGAVKAIPQLAAFTAQMFPQGRALGMATSIGAPMAAQAATNLIEGKPVGDDVVGEGALGGALQMPTVIGRGLASAGEGIMRRNLLSQTPVDQITDRMRDVLPKKALQHRAAATREGVDTMIKDKLVPAYDKVDDLRSQIASYTAPGVNYTPPANLVKALDDAELDFEDLREITDMLKAVEKQTHVRGSGSGINAVLPGSGPVTTAGRAAGLTPAIGQVLSPAVAAAKGSPARRMAIARNMHRPGNAVDMATLGTGTSQLARLLAAYLQSQGVSAEPMASHERTTGRSASLGAPRRRRQ